MKQICLYFFGLFLLLSVYTRVFAQQEITITGTVYDRDENKPLSNVSIYLQLKDGKQQPLGKTNEKGRFSVKAPANSRMQFRYVSYDPAPLVLVSGKTNYDILMKVSKNEMDEVVVVGYQEKKREDFTGSATIVSGKELQDVPVANVMQLLQGKVAGLNIQNNNGTPGMMGSVVIRGISNINIQGAGDQALLTPTSPLFVVDGIPIKDPTTYQYGFDQAGPGLSPLSMIPQEDIAEVQVLKDAQATSLYGSDGAYGVILITTKRGKSAVPIISYSGRYFVSTPPQLRDVIVGREERLLRIRQIMQYDTTYYHALNLINQTDFLSDSLNAYYNNNTDWQSLFYRTTNNQSHNVSFSGGDDKFNYKVNTGLFSQTGIIQNTGFSRYNMNMNMTYQPSSRFSLQAYVTSGLTKNSKGSGNSLAQTGVAEAANTSSLLPPPSLYTASNAALAASQVDDDNKSTSISTNVVLTYELIKNIRLGTTFGYTYGSGTEDTFYPGILNNDYAQLLTYNSVNGTIYSRNTITFTKDFDKHSVGVNVFNEINSSYSKSNKITQNGLPDDYIRGPFGYDWTQSSNEAQVDLDTRSASFVGAFNYNYDSKYYLNLSYRTDASSSNGPDRPWTKSPAFGLRWNFQKEKFMNKFSWLSYGGLRLSWGRTIQPSGSIYDIYGKYNAGVNYNNMPTIGLDLTANIPNLGLIPSTNTSWDFGFESGFFDSRLSLVYDYYYKQSDHILRQKDIANHNGFPGVFTNETSMVNYGHEISISVRPLSPNSKLKWQLSFNTAFNQDILAALPDGVRQLITGLDPTKEDVQVIINRLGINSLSNYLFNYKGVYMSDDQVPVDPLTGLRYRTGGTFANGRYFRAGDPIWTDQNGDYILDDNDRYIVGNAQPRFVGGISTNLQYGPFSFSTSISFTIGRDVLNNAIADRFRTFQDPTTLGALVPIDYYDFYQRPGQTAGYPNPFDFTRYDLYNPFRFDQTLFQEDGSYVKINSISLSYNLSKQFTQRFGISSMQLNANVSNLYTFSHYSGPNPEAVSSLGRDSSGGYPASRDYTLGLNIQF